MLWRQDVADWLGSAKAGVIGTAAPAFAFIASLSIETKNTITWIAQIGVFLTTIIAGLTTAYFTKRRSDREAEQAELDREAKEHADRAETAHNIAPNSEFTVLVLEDDTDTRRMYVRHLKAAGFEVVTAKNHTEALYVVEGSSISFEAAMLDLGLPDGNPIDVLDKLLARPETNVAVVTGGGDLEDEVKKRGVPIFRKPNINYKELISVLRGEPLQEQITRGMKDFHSESL